MFCACMSLLNYQRLTKPAESEYIKMKTRAPKKLLSLCTTNNLSPHNPLSPQRLSPQRPCTNTNLSPLIFYSNFENIVLSPNWARRDLVPILTCACRSFIQTWKYSPQKRTEAARCTSKKLKPSNFPKVTEIWFASRVMIFVKSPIESGKLFNEWERKELQAET